MAIRQVVSLGIIVALAAVLSACNSAPPTPTSTPLPVPPQNKSATLGPTTPLTSTPVALPTVEQEEGSVLITIGDNYYDPQDVIVKVGAKVEWWNGGGLPHNVISFDNGWGYSYMLHGTRYELIFNKAGTYRYTCTLHSGMDGVIKVVD